jgi:hypothetical protein
MNKDAHSKILQYILPLEVGELKWRNQQSSLESGVGILVAWHVLPPAQTQEKLPWYKVLLKKLTSHLAGKEIPGLLENLKFH